MIEKRTVIELWKQNVVYISWRQRWHNDSAAAGCPSGHTNEEELHFPLFPTGSARVTV